MEELEKRYLFLFLYKEKILSLCIEKKYNFDNKIKEIKSDINNYKNDNNKENQNVLLQKIRYDFNNLLDYKYYLLKNPNDNIIDMLSEFLLSDKEYTTTRLYKKIKSMNDIDSIIKGRIIRNRFDEMFGNNNYQPFTVWRILTYVREKHLDNDTALFALDKYFNIERYMLTLDNTPLGYGIDYRLKVTDERYNDITNKIKINNNYEVKDNYLSFDYTKENSLIGYNTSDYTKYLSKRNYLSLERKELLRNIINKLYFSSYGKNKYKALVKN